MGTLSVSSPAELAAIRKVLSSKTFARNPRLTALLDYLCRRSLADSTQSLKEFDIATDVFGRSPEFDQTTDAIVRVEMHRLRKKLKEYYATEGSGEPIEICLRAGKYRPTFRVRADDSMSDALDGDSAQSPEDEPSVVLRAAEPKMLPPSKWRVARLLYFLAAALLLLCCGGFLLHHFLTRNPAALFPVAPPAAFAPQGDSVRLLCGSSATLKDHEGRLWSHDAFYSGGASIENPDPIIYRTRDHELFRSARSGEFSYRIPLKPGVYELRLYFADTAYHPGTDMDGGEGERTFSVRLNGEVILRDFDVISDAGPDTADIKVFKDVRPDRDGYLHLAFSKQLAEPILNAIEIEPGILHRLRPIRIVTQPRALTDRSGVVWQADDFFLQGRNTSRFGSVNGPYDPQIYERERYGHFSYAIPVAAGSYGVTLHFAETYWGPGELGGGGVNSRIFEVECNGVTLLKDFDMLSKAKPSQQIVKVFRGLESSPQGTLLLSFIPKHNYATLSAIEASDESH